ncbi:hypothetical protein [Caproiciproducens sp.]
MNNNVYIRTIEASDVYSHMIRGTQLKGEYIGMIPNSLELLKLKQIGFKISHSKKINQQTSDDIINLEFNSNVKNGHTVMEYLKDKTVEVQKQIDVVDCKLEAFKKTNCNVHKTKLTERKNKLKQYLQKLTDYHDKIKNELDNEELSDNWNEVKIKNLRDYLVDNGFTITVVNKKTGKTKTTKYVCYKRSSAKSRTGQCLFIKEKLFKPMFTWSHMDIDFSNFHGDYTALLSYSALVGSAIEDTINIDPHKILLISDIDSEFNWNVNVVKYNDKKQLDSIPIDNYPVHNSIFDGESLLDSSYFQDGKAFYLLRHHFFKSAAFSTNLKQFLKDYHDNHNITVPFEEWELTSMLNEPLKASECVMITTPNSF